MKREGFIIDEYQKNHEEWEISSTHWEQLIKLEDEIDYVNQSIKNNFTTLKMLHQLEQEQRKEIKAIYKETLLTASEFIKECESIEKNARISRNAVFEELSYNTSFIVKKYQELTMLKKHTRIKEINSYLKKEQKVLKKQIKHQENQTKSEQRKAAKLWKKDSFDELKITKLTSEHEEKRARISEVKKFKEEKINQNLLKARHSTKFEIMIILIAISVPLMLLIGLLTNYFVYIPNIINEDGVKSKFTFNQETIPGFVISMIIVALILVVMTFLLFKTVKRIVVDRHQNSWRLVSIGFVASFFDILGVGSFATSLGMLKATKTIKDDKLIPGTLNMAFCIPNMIEASFLVSAINTEIITLIVLVLCGVVGSYFGTKLVAKFDVHLVKLVIGIALFVGAIIMILTTPQVGILGTTTGLKGLVGWWRWLFGCLGFLLVGVLMSFGVGSYAPSLVILSLLGMGMIYIAPIMMCTSAFLMPVTSYKFYKDNNYLPKTSLVMMLGGVFGATTAFLIFYVGFQAGIGLDRNGVVYTSIIKWITITVMLYSSITMFKESWFLSQNKVKDPIAKSRMNLKFVKNPEHLTKEIEKQYFEVLNRYNKTELDTKLIVQTEGIPMNYWVKKPNNQKWKWRKKISEKEYDT